MRSCDDVLATTGHGGDRAGREGAEADTGDEDTEGVQGNLENI